MLADSPTKITSTQTKNTVIIKHKSYITIKSFVAHVNVIINKHVRC